MTSGQPGPLLLVTALAWVAWAAPAPAVSISLFSYSGATTRGRFPVAGAKSTGTAVVRP